MGHVWSFVATTVNEANRRVSGDLQGFFRFAQVGYDRAFHAHFCRDPHRALRGRQLA